MTRACSVKSTGITSIKLLNKITITYNNKSIQNSHTHDLRRNIRQIQIVTSVAADEKQKFIAILIQTLLTIPIPVEM